MKSSKFLCLFIVGILLGVIADNWWSWHTFKSHLPAKSVELAFSASQQAEWLAHLRQNEIKETIELMEISMNGGVCAIAQYEKASPLNEQTRNKRDKCLIPIKIYYESYPVHGDEANLINLFMAKIPSRNIQSSCKSAICRMDDLRLDAANTNNKIMPK